MKRPEWFDETLFPFESRFLEENCARIHYVDEGQGPVLLMLHGQPTWSFLFRHLIERLRDRFRCVALDYPGFGLSTPPLGYDFRIHNQVRMVERFVERAGLDVLKEWEECFKPSGPLPSEEAPECSPSDTIPSKRCDRLRHIYRRLSA